MGGIFHGRCNDLARASPRLAFHDAGPYSIQLAKASRPNGAADGSLLVHAEELSRLENRGLQNIVAALQPLLAKYNVSPGDLLHLAGVLGVLACPGGPQIKVYVGRAPPSNVPAPDGLLPNPNSPVPVLTARFADMGFSVRELMALIGAHTAGRQRFVDSSKAGESFDSTVDVWDVRFYSESESKSGVAGTYRLNSDMNFSHDNSTTQDFNRFVGAGKQDDWGREYSAAHEKMSLVGLNNTKSLTDCSEILPPQIDLKNCYASSNYDGKTDPPIDPAKLEAQIKLNRAPWI
ncbi:heme peroxidase [Mycena polygramma]|nr:heme peroxidase [Mycena polygramma]